FWLSCAPPAGLTVDCLCTTDTAGVRQLGYALFPSTGATDAWYPVVRDQRFADFEVTIDAPAGTVVLTTGGTARVSKASGVEGFALGYGTGLITQTAAKGGVTVTALSSQADSAAFQRVTE